MIFPQCARETRLVLSGKARESCKVHSYERRRPPTLGGGTGRRHARLATAELKNLVFRLATTLPKVRASNLGMANLPTEIRGQAHECAEYDGTHKAAHASAQLLAGGVMSIGQEPSRTSLRVTLPRIRRVMR